jgi:predicted ATPase with chaperone activity
VLRVARTIADLEGHDTVSGEDMELALTLRGGGRPEAEAAA